MDTDSVRRMRRNFAQLLTNIDDSHSDLGSNNETSVGDSSEDPVPASLLSLPNFRTLREISEKKMELLTLENELHLKPFLKGFDKVQSVVYDGLELWNQVAKCLEFLRNSSQILQQALKDPTAENTLPLPHHLHSKAIQTIEDCIWMIKQKNWQPIPYEVNWETLLLKLEQEINNIMTSSKNAETHLKEVEDLKFKLDILLKSLPSLRRI